MKLPSASSLPAQQIAAEIAEMREASRAIAASPRKRLEFLREVGVLNSSKKRASARNPKEAPPRMH